MGRQVARNPYAVVERIRCTRVVVETPGTRGMVCTRPPRASTVSRPMIRSSGQSPLHQNIRLQRRDEGFGIRLRKNDHIIDAGQCGEDLGPLDIGHNGAIGTFAQRAHRTVGVHADHEQISQIAGCLQVPDMSDVHEVEAPVCKDDVVAAGGARPVEKPVHLAWSLCGHHVQSILACILSGMEKKSATRNAWRTWCAQESVGRARSSFSSSQLHSAGGRPDARRRSHVVRSVGPGRQTHRVDGGRTAVPEPVPDPIGPGPPGGTASRLKQIFQGLANLRPHVRVIVQRRGKLPLPRGDAKMRIFELQVNEPAARPSRRSSCVSVSRNPWMIGSSTAGSFVSSSKVVYGSCSWPRDRRPPDRNRGPGPAIETTPGGCPGGERGLIRIEGEANRRSSAPQALDGLRGFGTHAGQRANRQRGQKRGFRARFNHRQAVRFMRVGGDLGGGFPEARAIVQVNPVVWENVGFQGIASARGSGCRVCSLVVSA